MKAIRRVGQNEMFTRGLPGGHGAQKRAFARPAVPEQGRGPI